MKLILLLPLRLSKCTRFLLHFSCCIVMRNSTIYLLLLLLVRRTIKYIKIIVFPRYTQCSNVFYEVGFTLVNISFVFFSAFNVFETGNAICAELQQITGWCREPTAGGQCVKSVHRSSGNRHYANRIAPLESRFWWIVSPPFFFLTIINDSYINHLTSKNCFIFYVFGNNLNKKRFTCWKFFLALGRRNKAWIRGERRVTRLQQFQNVTVFLKVGMKAENLQLFQI